MFNMNLNSKPCHIFLTGEKHVGKSTLVNQIVKDMDLTWAGIKSITEIKDGKKYIYLTDAKSPKIEEKNLVGICSNNGSEKVFPEVFETYGVELLSKANGVQLFIVDEAGFLENSAPKYIDALLKIIERTNLHILGTVRMDENAVLYEKIINNENVKSFVIKEANRNNMAPVVNRLLHNEFRK